MLRTAIWGGGGSNITNSASGGGVNTLYNITNSASGVYNITNSAIGGGGVAMFRIAFR